MKTQTRHDGHAAADQVATSGDDAVQQLAELNIGLIESGCHILEGLTPAQYATPPASLSESSVGGHTRHCLEFYESLVDGLAGASIDYDARPRDQLVENDRDVAVERLRIVVERLRQIASEGDRTLEVCLTTNDGRRNTASSSLARELDTAANHTIHHFAIIAIFARAHGLEVDRSFGVAPATLRYRAREESTLR